MAYGMKDYQVQGPDWLRLERFDIAAKFPEALPRDREKYNAGLHAMMQNMLVDRFKLAVHRDTKTFSVYGLIIGKSFRAAIEDGDTEAARSAGLRQQQRPGRRLDGREVLAQFLVGLRGRIRIDEEDIQ